MKETPREITVQPLDDIPAGVLEAVAQGLDREFGLSSAMRESMPLPISAYNDDRRQYLSIMVIEELERLELEGLVLGIAREDIYAQGLNFIFGEADRERGIALISIARLMQEFYGGSPDPEKLAERAEKEAVHEVGHLLGVPHCKNPECVMRYSNTISHTDRKATCLCPQCKRKLTLMSIF